MRNWYIKIKDNSTITWFKNKLFRSGDWLDLKVYIQEVIGNTSVPSHSHSLNGDVTGTGSSVINTTLDKTAITGKTTVTALGADYILISDSSDGGNLKKALASDFISSGNFGSAESLDLGDRMTGNAIFDIGNRV